MKVLVTGAEGQVGKEIELNSLNREFELLFTNKEALDITNLNNLSEVIDNFEPEIIINAAAYTNVDSAEDNPEKAYEVNAKGPKNLAEICFNQSILLIHISTDYVFDGSKKTPYCEEDITNPINVYGSSKLKGEENIRSLMKNYIILRTSWVFSETGKNFVKTIVEFSKESEELTIVGDQLGSPTSAKSISEAILSICKAYEYPNFLSGTYHFSGGEFVSWFDFAQQITAFAKEHGLINKIPFIKKISAAEYPTRSKKPMYSCLSTDKIKDNFGIYPNNWRRDLENLILKLT